MSGPSSFILWTQSERPPHLKKKHYEHMYLYTAYYNTINNTVIHADPVIQGLCREIV